MRRLTAGRSVLLLSLLVTVATAAAEETRHEIAWDALRDRGAITGGTVLAADAATTFARLLIDNGAPQPATVTVLRLERPPITGARYGITGTVRHEDVQGAGFLEMWSIFPDGGRYFSRTLAPSGPLRSLTGSSDWRRFTLPFFNKEGAAPPTALVVNVVLPGPGRVELGPLRVVQYSPGDDPLASAGQWWSDATGGWVGGIAGSVLGILGGVVGWLGGTGRARGFVLGLTKALTGLGVVALALGLGAVVQGQPYGVYYPLVLVGFVCALVGALVLRPLRARYEALELRRMRAADVR